MLDELRRIGWKANLALPKNRLVTATGCNVGGRDMFNHTCYGIRDTDTCIRFCHNQEGEHFPHNRQENQLAK